MYSGSCLGVQWVDQVYSFFQESSGSCSRRTYVLFSSWSQECTTRVHVYYKSTSVQLMMSNERLSHPCLNFAVELCTHPDT